MSFKIAFFALVLFFSICFLKQVNSFALQPEGRIAGGHNAKPYSAPYIVSIQVKGKNEYTHQCGGSIINENWIVTAAHCLTVKKELLQIEAGRYNIGVDEDTAQVTHVKLMIKHKLYNGGVAPYDIGLIRTTESFKWTNAVQPIPLPKTDEMPTGKATLFGWGSISRNERPVFPDKLQTADVNVITLSECENLLASGSEKPHETNVCTGSPVEGISVCSADSGGPLVQNNKLIGVVSWGGVPCGQPNAPSVYVQVSKFIQWIKKNQK